MQQNITTATIRLKRELVWARRQVRLLGSLIGLSSTECRELSQVAHSILQNMRLNGRPVNLDFVLNHLNASGEQSLEIVMGQSFEECPDTASLDSFRATVESAKSQGLDVKSLFPDASDKEFHLFARLRLPISLDEPILPEVASQWSTILATGSADSALAKSQQSAMKLARSLSEANTRGANLEQELSSVKKLNETLELLGLVASKTDNGVVIADSQATIEWVNQSFERLVDFQLTNLVGMPLVELIAHATSGNAASRVAVDNDSTDTERKDRIEVQTKVSDERAEFVAELAEAIEKGNAFQHDFAFYSGLRADQWVSIGVTPVFDDRGQVTRWIVMARDVTEQRQNEEILTTARVRAEQASQFKSDFLANISHEIRTPMNAIVGLTELLLDTKLDQTQHEYAAIVHDSSAALLQLLNDLLDLSKIEAGQLAIHDVEFSLRNTVRSVMATFHSQARQSSISLTCNIDESLPDTLVGDPVRLRQILMNLTGNAVKFTQQGSVKVQVAKATDEVGTDERAVPDQIAVRFSVTDTGVGIAPDAMLRIFDPFIQAEGDTSERFGGTGLGLAICQELARLLNGRLWAESKVGIGSQFNFTCPFCVAGASERASSATGEDRQESIAGADVAVLSDDPDALQILVADDHAANRLLLRRILEKCNHLVDEACDGAEAIAMVQAKPYDLILLDIRMPNVDGPTAAKQIRDMADTLPKLPKIVAVTANAQREDREKYIDMGMDEYLSKPIAAQTLIALISRTVSTPKSEQDADASLRTNSAQLQREQQSEDSRFEKPLSRMESDREMLVEQMGFFLEDAPKLLKRLNASIQKADGKNTQLLAHRLKGVAFSFDAHELARTLTAIELEPIAQDSSLRTKQLAEIETAVQQLTNEMNHYMDT